MKKIIQTITPPRGWRTPVAILLGIFAGLVIYLFQVSNAVSYLSDKPETCVNCHIMAPQYATWNHSSHRENATCNDCHVPHDNVIKKYLFKAQDGMRHATIFTLRNEPQVIFIRDAGATVVQENCKRCHTNVNENVSTIDATFETVQHDEGKLCWECHREVPHGRVNSLSSTPYARVPLPQNAMPAWFKEFTNRENNSTDTSDITKN